MSKRKLLVTTGVVGVILLGVAAGGVWLVLGDMRADKKLPPCEALPSLAVAQQTLEQHPEMVARLENLKPGNHVWLKAYSPKGCPGKGAINITYPGVQTRDEIKEILGGTFFGVPITFTNV